jgi:glycerol kinase
VSTLVIDVGTSNVRVSRVDVGGIVTDSLNEAMPAITPFPGLVEFNPTALAATVLGLATTVLDRSGPVDAVGISNQRASVVVWERTTGEVVGTGLGWQDLRTVGECIAARAEFGWHLAPNQSATKIAWLLEQHDPQRQRDLCAGTIDCWLTWHLTDGRRHVTDHTNAAVTGLTTPAATEWSAPVCESLRIPRRLLPDLVATVGVVDVASALPGAPPLAALVGDQQASMAGQGCMQPGQAKITFGTGGMLDVCTGGVAPAVAERNPHGTFPIVCRSTADALVWGAESIMLSAGSNVAWLHEDMGLIDSPAASHDVASSCDSADGVIFVPALLGLGTPQWDYGARGTLLGVTRGTTRAHIVRAVLEGIAHRGADLVDAARADTDVPITALRVDGGMSANATFVQALADATQLPIEVSAHVEATTAGAAALAELAAGGYRSEADVCEQWSPARVVNPEAVLDRDVWRDAVERARGWIPALSALDF